MRAVVVALVAGCYAPTTPANVACSESGACPHGQTCVGGVCRLDGDLDPVDAPPGDGDAPPTDSGGRDALPVDAPPNACVGGDGVCLVACVQTDPDCTTTCGDNRCVGNAGELCGNCSEDCATTTVVCGNADCEPGESPDCYADCGPTPWTWASDEQLLTTAINQLRTQGHTCPGGMMVTRPALAVDASMLAGAREWAWEIDHHRFHPQNSGGEACNGRTLAQRKAGAGNFTGYVFGVGHASAQAAFDSWRSSSTLCPILMSANASAMNVGVALSGDRGFVLLMK